MPQERREHVIEPLHGKTDARGRLILAYPERFLFFDSESHVDKPEINDDHAPADAVYDPIWHEPRLVCLEYWEARVEIEPETHRRSRTVPLAYDRCVNDPVSGEAIRDQFHHLRPSDVRPPDLADRDLFRTPSAACHAFWLQVARLATHTRHGRSHQKLTVVGHNIGYDMIATGAYVWLPRICDCDDHAYDHDACQLACECHRWELEFPYEKGPVYITRARCGRKTMEFISSTNFYHDKLANVARSFGTEKLDIGDFNTPDVVKLLEYCRQDVVICRLCVVWLALTLDHGDDGGEPDGQKRLAPLDFIARGTGKPLGPWKATIASISFAVWRFRFLRDDHAPTVHVDPAAIMAERASYVGGRTEVWRLGEWDGEAHDVDVNNLYGYIMRNFSTPRRLIRYELIDAPSANAADTIDGLKDRLRRGTGLIANVTITIHPKEGTRDAFASAVVPQKGDRLFFPVGTFRVTLCSPELWLVLDSGTIDAVHSIAEYEMAPIFADAITWLSAKRVEAEGDPDHKLPPDHPLFGKPELKALRRLFKDLANNLYGKFGQMSEQWHVAVDENGVPLPGGRPHRERFDLPDHTTVIRVTLPGGVYESSGDREESFNAFPAIASFITSYARVHLWKLRAIAEGRDGRHTFYCDTDALIVDNTGFKRLVDAEQISKGILGKMKQEWTARRVTVEGAKWYSAEIMHRGHVVDEEDRCIVGLDGEQPTVRADGVKVLGPHWHRLIKHKGVPDRANLKQIGGQMVYVYEQFPRLAGHIGDGEVGRFENKIVRKKSTVDYGKAINPNPDRADGRPGPGWLRPFRLPEDAVAGLVPGLEAV